MLSRQKAVLFCFLCYCPLRAFLPYTHTQHTKSRKHAHLPQHFLLDSLPATNIRSATGLGGINGL